MSIILLLALFFAVVLFLNANALLIAARWNRSKLPRSEAHAEAAAYFIGAIAWFAIAWSMTLFFGARL
jgi:hypothetical protein